VSFKAKFSKLILKLWRWTPVGERPEFSCVITAGPHTANIDYVLMMLMAWSRGMELSWMGKHTLFEKPILGKFFTATGGIPVDRTAPQGLVGQMVERFEQTPRLYLAIPPEGTRSLTEYWKSGFYRIAQGAGVPIVMCSIDTKTRVVEIGPTVHPSGDLVADMDLFREYYGPKVGFKPELYGPIRLREEEALGDGDALGDGNADGANPGDATDASAS